MMKNFFEKLREDKKLLFVILIGVFGALMLVFLGSEQDPHVKTENSEDTETTSAFTSSGEIEHMLEEKIEKIVSQVKGAGKVSAVVSVGSTGEYVYAENIKSESDIDSSSEDSEIVIYESQDGTDSGLIISIKNPEIIGVAIVCEGGESSVVKAEVTNLVTSLFGIGSDRVYVGSKAVG